MVEWLIRIIFNVTRTQKNGRSYDGWLVGWLARSCFTDLWILITLLLSYNEFRITYRSGQCLFVITVKAVLAGLFDCGHGPVTDSRT